MLVFLTTRISPLHSEAFSIYLILYTLKGTDTDEVGLFKCNVLSGFFQFVVFFFFDFAF